ncbi:MAG: inositol monophosphatase [Gammaproteobacteria bacterium]|nr:inositol monophosphatase [Gammaproteobacteria bacterium]
MTDNHHIHEIAIFAANLARRAGDLIRRERSANALSHQYKDAQELVTSADVKADELIVKAIRQHYPTHRILSEESAPDKQAAADLETPLWIVDPIDGTVNYAYGHDTVAVCIAYAEQGRVRMGVVYCPFRDETFQAILGEGATLNHEPLQVSTCERLDRALVATGFPYRKDNLAPLIQRLDRVLHVCRDIRRIGSAAIDICWVAAGRLDAYYESVSPWDFAAARLIAGEAGARCGHFSPVPDGYPEDLWGNDILISAPALFDPLHEVLQG